MKTIRHLLLLFFCIGFSSYSKAQSASLIRLDQLEARLAAGRDTTFIVNFWATWCGPCVEELPGFVRIQQEQGDSKLRVLLVSLDFKSKLQSEVNPFLKKKAIPLECFLLDEQDQQAVIARVSGKWSGAIPATLVVNTASSRREFHEREFTYQELKKLIH